MDPISFWLSVYTGSVTWSKRPASRGLHLVKWDGQDRDGAPAAGLVDGEKGVSLGEAPGSRPGVQTGGRGGHRHLPCPLWGWLCSARGGDAGLGHLTHPRPP